MFITSTDSERQLISGFQIDYILSIECKIVLLKIRTEIHMKSFKVIQGQDIKQGINLTWSTYIKTICTFVRVTLANFCNVLVHIKPEKRSVTRFL